ncbi:phage terminase small subunit [Paenibacillus sp. LHD-117]|uniref:phage terminase small subunit n=1 Tax=Paenibacillus sp. LHD-117 TaxID=3071412 RepID=UPI0027E07DF6|nr:phage terminase small subunit [Paenibacillus sp. LHD-117]MDQ6418685.1 phage terminase small subunit [Paenibacillus sp. LHD-117]
MNVVARPRSTNRSAALKLWMKSGRTMKLSDIAEELGVSDVMIRKWKFTDKWDEIPDKRPRGAPKGNKNAVGNSGGAAPIGNQNAFKNGYYTKYLPEEVAEIVREVEEDDPLNVMWKNITILQAKFLHGQRITHVEKEKDWDKHVASISADAKIMKELRSAIRQFLNAAPENDERRARLEMMDVQIEKKKTEHELVKLQVEKLGGKDNVRKLETFL